MRLKNRIPEIDLIRGVAIILMVIFHTVVDLKDFYQYDLEYLNGFWYFEGKTAAILFMLIAGTSSVFNKNSLKHGLLVFVWGMVLSVITYIYNPGTYIRFGILHFLGCSLITYPLLRTFRPLLLLVLAISAFWLGTIFSAILVSAPYLLPFGLTTATFVSIDYYPLFPWYGVFLLGVAVGKIVYPKPKSLFPLMEYTNIRFLGQHSLLIYLVHQPILLSVLFIIHLKVV